jgi:hypothetical protein
VDVDMGLPVWREKDPVLPPGTTGSQDWRALRYVVLHELGHVFGNDRHADGTAMSPRGGEILEVWTAPVEPGQPGPFLPYGPPRALEVDQERELVLNLGIAADYSAWTDQWFCSDSTSAYAPCPAGERPDSWEPGQSSLRLVFTDSRGASREVAITTIARIDQKTDTPPLFNGQHGNKYRSFGASFLGTAQAPSGKTMAVAVNYNTRARLTIVDLSGSEPGLSLFQGD